MKKKHKIIAFTLALFLVIGMSAATSTVGASGLKGFKKNIRGPEYKKLRRFGNYMVGFFDNTDQVLAELEDGQLIHPFAVHVNAIINDRIMNLPEDFDGLFFLEETYYTYPGQPTTIKPYLFQFDINDVGDVRITSYVIPSDIPVEEFTHDNPDWVLDYNELTVSPTFPPSVYTYNEADKSFSISVTFPIAPGMTFTLEEEIYNKKLYVLESIKYYGIPIFPPYSTPIVYERQPMSYMWHQDPMETPF